VISDYLPARQTIPRLVEQRGCSWQITEDDGKTFRLEMKKGDRAVARRLKVEFGQGRGTWAPPGTLAEGVGG